MISRSSMLKRESMNKLRRCFVQKIHFSSTNTEAPHVTASAKDISKLFNIEISKSMEIAKQLSTGARNELSNISTKLRASIPPTVVEPQMKDLRIHAFTCGIPFIGFGICDNAILIIAGDVIDQHLGILFGISTLCAAAIGNIISDIAGVGLGAYIEDFCATKLRLPKANLTIAQRNLRSVRMYGQFGNMVGLTIGCIVGMFPLLLIDSEEVQQQKKDAHMDQIFNDVVTEAKGMIGAESTCMYLIVDETRTDRPTPFRPKSNNKDGKFLFAKYETDKVGEGNLIEPISKGIAGRAATSGEIIFVTDIENDPDYNPSSSFHKTHDNVKNMLCVPVYDVHGNTIAVLQAINKLKKDNTKNKIGLRRFSRREAFTADDGKILQTLASHISVSLQNMYREEDASLKEIVKILKEHEARAK